MASFDDFSRGGVNAVTIGTGTLMLKRITAQNFDSGCEDSMVNLVYE